MRGRSCCDSRRGANASQSGSRSLVSCRSPPEASPFLIERFPGRFEAEPRPESRSAPAQDARLAPCGARCWEEQSVSRGRSPARGGRLPLTPRPRPRTTPPISLSKDRGLPEENSQAFQPGFRLYAVTDAAHEPEMLCDVVSVGTNSLLGGPDIESEEVIHPCGFREQISGVPGFRLFNRNRPFEFHNEFVSEQVHLPGTLQYLAVTEGIVAGLPGDLFSAKMSGNSNFTEQPLDLGFRDRFPLDAGVKAGEEVGVLAENVMPATCRLNALAYVSRERYLNPAGQRLLPSHETPFPILHAISTGLEKRRANLRSGIKQMFPLIPCEVPHERHRRLVHDNLKPASCVTVYGAISEEVKFAQRRVKAALAKVGQESKNSPDKERFPVVRPLTFNQHRPEPTIGKERGRVRVFQEGIVTGAQFRLGQDIEGPLDRLEFTWVRVGRP